MKISRTTRVRVWNTVIEVLQRDLLQTSASAIMLSANNRLKASQTRWSWSQEIERRAGLEQAEVYRIPAIAMYIMAIRQGYGAGPSEQMAEALFRAAFDRAAITAAVERIVVCEQDSARFDLGVYVMSTVANRH